MNIFDLNRIQPGNGYTGNVEPQKKQTEQLPIEQAVNQYLQKSNGQSFSGMMLNSTDVDLIHNHLENYLATDSLRLELQIDRLSNDIKETQEQLKALSLLENSESKLNQQKILLAKRQQLTDVLIATKEEYRQLSPMHRFGLWLKDKMKSSNGAIDKIKQVVYGKKAAFMGEIKQANTSIKLLAGQVERMNNTHTMQEGDVNLIDIIKQYNKIDQNIEQVKSNYYSQQPPDYINLLKKGFQKVYYGYEIPDEHYNAQPNKLKYEFNFGQSKKSKDNLN